MNKVINNKKDKKPDETGNVSLADHLVIRDKKSGKPIHRRRG